MLCKHCGALIRVMCQQGTGFCCQNHEDAYAEISGFVSGLADRLGMVRAV